MSFAYRNVRIMIHKEFDVLPKGKLSKIFSKIKLINMVKYLPVSKFNES